MRLWLRLRLCGCVCAAAAATRSRSRTTSGENSTVQSEVARVRVQLTCLRRFRPKASSSRCDCALGLAQLTYYMRAVAGCLYGQVPGRHGVAKLATLDGKEVFLKRCACTALILLALVHHPPVPPSQCLRAYTSASTSTYTHTILVLTYCNPSITAPSHTTLAQLEPQPQPQPQP